MMSPLLIGVLLTASRPQALISVRGEVIDAGTGAPLACRLYIQGPDGSWHFAKSDGGSAVEYNKQGGNRGQSVEKPADVYSLGILLAELALGKIPDADTSVRAGSTLRSSAESRSSKSSMTPGSASRPSAPASWSRSSAQPASASPGSCGSSCSTSRA